MTAQNLPWKKPASLILLFIFLLSAALIRLGVAEKSAGPDIAQFWAFAKVFDEYGFAFYKYASATLDIFPFKAWSYNYTPIWVLILYGVYLIVPGSLATAHFVSESWRLGMKAPLIFSDLMIGLLIFLMVPGNYRRKLLFCSLWLFNPLVWYESAIFGQFDSIMVLFLTLGLYGLQKRHDRWAYFFFALSILTKQHAAVAVTFILLSQWSKNSLKHNVSCLAVLLGTGGIVSLPFIYASGFGEYLYYLSVPAGWLRYQEPLVYAFSGIGSLLTYIHHLTQIETLFLMKIFKFILLIIILFVAVLLREKSLDPLRAALTGFTLLLGLSTSVNYQYLVVIVLLTSLVAANANSLKERLLLIVLALYPGTWIWTFDIGFWFRYFEPMSPGSADILNSFGVPTQAMSDLFYVAFATGLMLLMLMYVIITTRRLWTESPLRSAKIISPVLQTIMNTVRKD